MPTKKFCFRSSNLKIVNYIKFEARAMKTCSCIRNLDINDHSGLVTMQCYPFIVKL